MNHFTVEGFADGCKKAMRTAEDPHQAARAFLEQTLKAHERSEIIQSLDASIPPNASVGEMIVHASPELTMLYGRVPPRFQSGIHDHTVFACIGQLEGEEHSILYEKAREDGKLRMLGRMKVRAGEVISLPADVIHSIENPGSQTASALHIYGGDFGAIMERRTLWSTEDRQPMPFTFEALLEESAKAMKQSGNETGLRELVKAIPAAVAMVEAL